MVEIAISIAGKVSEYFVEPVVHQLSYIWNYKTNCENLETEVRKLSGRRDTVEHSVEASRRNGEEIEQQVNSWFDVNDNSQISTSAQSTSATSAQLVNFSNKSYDRLNRGPTYQAGLALCTAGIASNQNCVDDHLKLSKSQVGYKVS